MKKFSVWDSELTDHEKDPGPDQPYSVVYLASEVDARIAELENELKHVTRQRDETFEKLKAAEGRIQQLTFGKN